VHLQYTENSTKNSKIEVTT